MQKEAFKITEKMLFNYKDLEMYIKKIDLDIETLKLDYDCYGGISYDKDKLSKSNNMSNEIEDLVVRKDKEIKVLEREKKKLELEKKRLDIAINNLNSDQTIVFRMRYIERCNWIKITQEMHISKDTFYRIRDQLIESVMNSLNQKKVLKDVEKRMQRGYKCSFEK